MKDKIMKLSETKMAYVKKKLVEKLQISSTSSSARVTRQAVLE
jgi:hypothetical protein